MSLHFSRLNDRSNQMTGFSGSMHWACRGGGNMALRHAFARRLYWITVGLIGLSIAALVWLQPQPSRPGARCRRLRGRCGPHTPCADGVRPDLASGGPHNVAEAENGASRYADADEAGNADTPAAGTRCQHDSKGCWNEFLSLAEFQFPPPDNGSGEVEQPWGPTWDEMRAAADRLPSSAELVQISDMVAQEASQQDLATAGPKASAHRVCRLHSAEPSTRGGCGLHSVTTVSDRIALEVPSEPRARRQTQDGR